LGGTLIIETVFSLPGLGTLAATAIQTKDTPMAVTSVIFVASLFALVTVFTDLTYAFVDPRIKAIYKK